MSVVHVWGCDCVSISRGRWVCFLVARRPQCPHTWPLRSLPCSGHCTRCTRFSRFQVTRRGREGRDHPMCAASPPGGTPGLIAQQHSTPEMRNSVKPGARWRIYSQLRRSCRASIKSTWQPGKSSQVKPCTDSQAESRRAHATSSKT